MTPSSSWTWPTTSRSSGTASGPASSTSPVRPPHSAEQVKALGEKDIEKVKEEERKTSKEHDDVEKRMKKLKATLYGKFGNSINLD